MIDIKNKVKITTLGTGRFGCDDGKAHQSILLEYNNTGIMVDCGATSVLQLKRFNIDYDRIDYVFLTHYHGDHIAGLPFMMLDIKINPDIKKRTKPLTIIGKNNVEDKIVNLCKAMNLPYENELVNYIDLVNNGKDILTDELPDDIKFEHFNVVHKEESVAYKFYMGDKIIGISGDTDWIDEIYEISDKCDIFYPECSMLEEMDVNHISFEELKNNLNKLNCKKIKVVHTFKPVINEIIKLDNPKLDYAKDGEIIML